MREKTLGKSDNMFTLSDKISADTIFGGKNRQQDRFSALLSTESFSDKVLESQSDAFEEQSTGSRPWLNVAVR